MAARPTSRRGGDRSEPYAEAILSAVATVAEVPRQDDFGVDQICSLIRYQGRAYTVENTFGVQVKSAGVDDVRFGGADARGCWREDRVRWLYGQSYPYFIAVVDKRQQRLRLYSTMRMWWVVWTRGWPFEVRLTPDLEVPGDTPDRYPRERCDGDHPGSDNYSWIVPLGKPVIDVTAGQVEDHDFKVRLCDCLREWVRLDERNIYNRKMNAPITMEWMEWEANVPPALPAKEMIYGNPRPDMNIRETLLAARPVVKALAFNLGLQDQKDRIEILRPLVELFDGYDLADDLLKRVLRGKKSEN